MEGWRSGGGGEVEWEEILNALKVVSAQARVLLYNVGITSHYFEIIKMSFVCFYFGGYGTTITSGMEIQ